MTGICVRFIMALATLACMPASAIAFEQDGFRSGMSVEEFKAVARRMGPNLRPDPDGDNIYLTDLEMNASFCEGRLFGVSKSVSGGVDAFASTSKDMISQYGPPQVKVSSSYGKGGLFSSVEFVWSVNGEERHASLYSSSGNVSVHVGIVVWSLCK
ncbi:hypothetical protein [Rhizobium sp. RAF56]|uniref:hypothetical protein n=1 Tax=Rhizobium sp. RAF56 TaxID=3233062 RepID=UPI003F94DE12